MCISLLRAPRKTPQQAPPGMYVCTQTGEQAFFDSDGGSAVYLILEFLARMLFPGHILTKLSLRQLKKKMSQDHKLKSKTAYYSPTRQTK